MARPRHGVLIEHARLALALVCIAAAGAALGPAPAAGHAAGSEPAGARGPDAEVSGVVLRRSLGDRVTTNPNGLYRVRPEVGAPVLTHGPESTKQLTESGPLGESFGPGAPQRPPVCAGDYRQRVVYAHVAGTPDRSGELTAELRAIMGRMNAVLSRESLASGGGTADFRVACNGDGQVAISSLEVADSSLASIADAARLNGISEPHSDLTIFLDATVGDACGVGSYSDDDRLAIDNANNDGGDFAVVYEPCWETEAVMHEVAHNQGAVQASAERSTGSGGHCNDEIDVLCYAPDGGERNQQVQIRCSDRIYLDCGHDDYFDSAPEPGEYLATHWNLGSALNRFIDFGPPPPPPSPGDAAPPPPSGEDEPGNGPAGAPGPAELEPEGGRVKRLRKRARGLLPGPGEWLYYRLRVPARRSLLQLDLRAPAGSRLYVKRGRRPSAEATACASKGRGKRQRCRVRRPRRGVWFVGVTAATTERVSAERSGGSPRFRLRVRLRGPGKR